MSIAERMEESVGYIDAQIKGVDEEIADLERRMTRARDKRVELVLERIEVVTAANLLREAGLRVEMRDGLPTVSVERLLAEPTAVPA